MNTKPNHTRLPWWVASGTIWAGNGLDTQIAVAAPDRDEPRTSPTERDANAEFICRAVNSHDELIAALEEVIAHWHGKPSNFYRKEPSYLAPVRAAIAKAKGEKAP